MNRLFVALLLALVTLAPRAAHADNPRRQ